MSVGNFCQCVVLEITVTDTLATSEAIQYENFDVGEFYVTGSPTTLAWYTSHDGVTYGVAYNEAGTTAVTQTAANTLSYPIPAALAGARWIKAEGVAACTLNVVLKA